MRPKLTMAVWTLCGLTGLAQAAPPEPTPLNPAVELGLGAKEADKPGRPTAPPVPGTPPLGLPPGAMNTIELKAIARGLRLSSSIQGGGETSNYRQIPSLVLKFSDSDEAVNSTMEEDLAIMTKLVEDDLKKGVGEGGVDKALGIDLVYTGSRSVRAMYLEGFGALFMIKVNFPVFSPEAVKEHKETAVSSSGSEWERAKRELYGQTERELSSVSSRSKYNPAQVEALKKVLMQSMKNTANIRELKPDEWVSFSVFGHPVALSKVKKGSSEKSSKRRVAAAGAAAAEEPEPPRQAANRAYAVGFSSQVSADGTVMTLRAKRKDVEAFASGKLNADEFAKRVETQSYFGNGYGVLSVNSWLKESR